MTTQLPTPGLRDLFVYVVTFTQGRETWQKVGTARETLNRSGFEIELEPEIKRIGGRIVVSEHNYLPNCPVEIPPDNPGPRLRLVKGD